MAEKNLKTPPAATAPAASNKTGLGVLALAGIVVSSMIGGGIYSLPQNMAAGASAGAVLLAWIITGIGIYFIANTFSILSMAKPNLKTGIYSYSEAGFGKYAGFTIGWSYWFAATSVTPLLPWTPLITFSRLTLPEEIICFPSSAAQLSFGSSTFWF